MIYVITLNQLFWTLTEEKILPFMRLFWEEKQKYLQSFQNKATYHLMNSELFPHNIWWNQHNTLYNSGKGRYSEYMWSNDMFILWNRISAIFYGDTEYCLEVLPKQHAFVH